MIPRRQAWWDYWLPGFLTGIGVTVLAAVVAGYLR